MVDGTGAPSRRADVAIAGDRIVAIEESIDANGGRKIDAEGRVVTPGFVDVHTHLDAQLGWDPLPTSSCWHGITSVVLGNCGVTFAPVAPGEREFLAEMMESVEDIPRRAILEGLPWDWTTYGDYLGWLDRTPKGINVGGLVGHCALRVAAMGERAMVEGSGTPEDIARMCEMAEEALRAGALGISTSRTLGHDVPDGRPVPGTWAGPDELLAFGDVLGRVGQGLFEGAMRLGERDDEALTKTRAEVAVMGDISRRSGRPVSYGLVQSNRRPDLYSQVIELRPRHENANGAAVRPQTTARGIGILFGLFNRTPWDRAHGVPRAPRAGAGRERLAAIRDPQWRARLIADGADARLMLGPGHDLRAARRAAPATTAAPRTPSPPTPPVAASSPVEAFLDLCRRERRHGQPQHAAAQPPARRRRGDARRRAGDPRPGRRRRPRRPDHGHQPADVPADLLGARAPALDARGGGAPVDVGHRRTCSASPIEACCGPAATPTST